MAKAIMIQGTMSNAGKSLVTAALCRIFHQDGKRVNPFKSQNMALNSFITAEGAEMGRAQVVQAEAAGVKPSVLMNPILLKPTSDSGSQVIVNGVAIGTMPAVEYYKFKTKLIPDIMKAYNLQRTERKLLRRISMSITGTQMDCKQDFRNALRDLIRENNYHYQVDVIDYKEWNNNMEEDLKQFYNSDGLHLNQKGYMKLDSVIAKHIANN